MLSRPSFLFHTLPVVIALCLGWALLPTPQIRAGGDQTAPGLLEGQLKIFSPQTVDLADGSVPPVTPEMYAKYPLVVFAQDGKTQVAIVTADKTGGYRITLAPGSYVLDVKDRVRKHVRAKPRPFQVVSNQTATVNMDMDTGIR